VPQARHGTEQWLFAAEQRYQQLAARRQTAAVTAPDHEYDGWSMTAAPTANEPYDHYSVMASPYSHENQYERRSTHSVPPTATATAPKAKPLAENASAPTVRKRLRSNLLPRMNALDSRTAQQEMAMLQNSIETMLPGSHESRVRARHLLEKAHTILLDDPARSAEVEYYLQQVRMIVQRVQEAAHWSQLYQRRLRTYLFAWLALSIVVILSRYLYAAPLENWLAHISGQSSSNLWIYNILTLITAFFFGALGGGSGALLNLVRHTQMGFGFFDRKYGLRGLILPLIGALSGLVFCVIFGIGYALLGLEPTSNLWFGLVPALLALALGASQEYLYGTR
jgi:hypothetical protein